mmetsp:Transcript_68684/g.129593  ORF Transcript_68684/g.129593 Transcript_68684/m.129593 type:complete len:318 (-) Transcript_68684:64-1017(-)
MVSEGPASQNEPLLHPPAMPSGRRRYVTVACAVTVMCVFAMITVVRRDEHPVQQPLIPVRDQQVSQLQKLATSAKCDKMGLTRKASFVQMISTVCFLGIAYYLNQSRPDAAAPRSFKKIDVSVIVWLIIVMFVVEGCGQTFLGLAGWFSDRPDNFELDFRDEFVFSDTWSDETSKVVPWCSYFAYLAKFVIIPTMRFTIFSWAVGAPPWMYKVVIVLGALLALSWVYVIVTWKQTFKVYGLAASFLAPLCTGIALLCAAFRAKPPASRWGLTACGVSLVIYVALIPMYIEFESFKRWHGEALSIFYWALLAGGAAVL